MYKVFGCLSNFSIVIPPVRRRIHLVLVLQRYEYLITHIEYGEVFNGKVENIQKEALRITGKIKPAYCVLLN